MTHPGSHQVILDPESTTVRTATDVLLAHAPGDDASPGGWCPRCNLSHPCPPAIRARQVRLAAGLPPDPEGLPPGPSGRPEDGGRSEGAGPPVDADDPGAGASARPTGPAPAVPPSIGRHPVAGTAVVGTAPVPARQHPDRRVRSSAQTGPAHVR